VTGQNFVQQTLNRLKSRAERLLLQEHWLSEGQLQLLGEIDANFLYAGVSGFDNSDVLTGRPYGGCAILWRSNLAATINVISTNSKRVCAIRVSTDTIRLLIINVYMPYENAGDSTTIFIDQLSVIAGVIDDNADCHVIVGGDFNVDLSRDWLHTGILRTFCDNTGLCFAMEHDRCSIDYTYNFNMSRFNSLDHFLLSETIFDTSLDYVRVLHDIDNLSDHDPIAAQVRLQTQFLGSSDRIYKPRSSWVKASEVDLHNYRRELSCRLRDIVMPVDAALCRDLRCTDLAHIQAIDNFAKDLTNACLEVAGRTIPRTSGNHDSGRIPGWSERCEPLREKSLFWHRLWLECDRPRNGAVADSMRRTRAMYHYAVRQTKKERDSIVRERTAVSMLNNRTRNFWSEIKRIRSNKAGVCNSVDGFTDSSCIAQLFAAKYRLLYNSVSYDRDEMQYIINRVDTALADTPVNSDCIFDVNDVKSAVSRLKPHKNEGCSDLSSDHIINAGDDCFIYIACLLTAIVIHGMVPDTFQRSAIVSIPKGRHTNLSDSSNFRGIALSSIIGKIFDNIILQRYNHKLSSCELQFGFKSKSSTNMCTMVLKETITYYVQHQSPVFCTFLDATKAIWVTFRSGSACANRKNVNIFVYT
jgi:hypothetical protein